MGRITGGVNIGSIPGLITYLNADVFTSGSTSWDNLLTSGVSTGSLVNGPTYTSGPIASINFDGINDHANINLPNAGTYSTISVEGWIKWISYNNGMFLGMDGYDVFTANNCLGYNNGQSNVVGIDAATVNSLGLIGNWKHYVFVMNSSGLLSQNKIYINSIPYALTPVLNSDGNCLGISTNLRLCEWNNTVGNYAGNLSYSTCLVYNRELTQSEITTNFNGTKVIYGL
jgi:hypothetical protein